MKMEAKLLLSLILFSLISIPNIFAMTVTDTGTTVNVNTGSSGILFGLVSAVGGVYNDSGAWGLLYAINQSDQYWGWRKYGNGGNGFGWINYDGGAGTTLIGKYGNPGGVGCSVKENSGFKTLIECNRTSEEANYTFYNNKTYYDFCIYANSKTDYQSFTFNGFGNDATISARAYVDNNDYTMDGTANYLLQTTTGFTNAQGWFGYGKTGRKYIAYGLFNYSYVDHNQKFYLQDKNSADSNTADLVVGLGDDDNGAPWGISPRATPLCMRIGFLDLTGKANDVVNTTSTQWFYISQLYDAITKTPTITTTYGTTNYTNNWAKDRLSLDCTSAGRCDIDYVPGSTNATEFFVEATFSTLDSAKTIFLYNDTGALTYFGKVNNTGGNWRFYDSLGNDKGVISSNMGILNTSTYTKFQMFYTASVNNQISISNISESTPAIPTLINLFLNDTKNDLSTTYGKIINITAKINVTGLPVTLTINGTQINQGATRVENISDVSWFANSTYVVSATYTGNSTFTSSSATYYIRILKAQTTMNLTINGSQSNQVYTYPSTSNASASNNVTGTAGVTLLRDGSSVSIPEIIMLPAGTYNYTASFSHQNYTAFPINYSLTINKASSELSLTASPGWSIAENSQVTISCSGSPGYTLYRDGVSILSPYSTVLTFGSYNFTCILTDIQNYTPSSISNVLTVISGGFGCTNTNTYAFKKTIAVSGTSINLDFSSLISSNITRADLGDVYVNTTNTSSKMNGTYLVVNVANVSSIDVLFGNYVIKNIYSSATLSANTTNMSSYSQINDYYSLSFFDEKTGNYIIPPGANSTVSLLCSGGSTSFAMNNSKLLVATFSQLDEIKTTTQYSTTEIYYRNLQVKTGTEYKNFYLVDANKYQVVELLFTLSDISRQFKGSTLRVKKWLEGTEQTITELPFDAQYKAIVYLINGDRYNLYVDNGVEERTIGYLYVDAVDLTKTIVIGNIATTNYTSANVSYALSFISGVISFTYVDTGSNTNLVNFWVWNYTNQSQLLYSASSTNRSVINFNFIAPDPNGTYLGKWEIHSDVFGNETSGGMDVLIGAGAILVPAVFPLITIITTLGGNGSLWFTFLFILPFGLIFTERYAQVGVFALIGLSALFVYWRMYAITGTALALALFLGVLIHLKSRGGEET